MLKSTFIFSLALTLVILIAACQSDHHNFAPMKGINYISRNDVFPLEQISFQNSGGVAIDTLKKLGVLVIAPNTFTNEDGSVFSGRVTFSIKENYVRGFLALNSIPSVTEAGSPLYVVGSVFFSAADSKGNKLKIASGKNINISIPGSSTAYQSKMFYGNDFVKDPAPSNTSLFNWAEATADTISYYFNNNNSKYYYELKPTQLVWVSCAQTYTSPNLVGIKVKVLGTYISFATNTAVYVVPKNGKSVFRLWNFDSNNHTFSTDQAYLEQGSEAYIIAIGIWRQFRIFYAKELIKVGVHDVNNVNTIETSLGNVTNSLNAL